MREIKTVRVSGRGEVEIPADIRRKAGIRKGDSLFLIEGNGSLLLKKAKPESAKVKSEFNHLLKQSEQVMRKFWSSKADDVWDTI